MAMELVRVRGLAIALVVMHAVLSWPNVIPLYARQDAWRMVKVTWREALRIKNEDEFLHSNLMNYDITRVIERAVPPGDKSADVQPRRPTPTPRATCSPSTSPPPTRWPAASC